MSNRYLIRQTWASDDSDAETFTVTPFTGTPQEICGLSDGTFRLGVLDWSDEQVTIDTSLTPANVAAKFEDWTIPEGSSLWSETGVEATPIELVGANELPLAATTAATIGVSGTHTLFGLLLNAYQYNYLLYSDDLTNAAWTKVGSPTITKDQPGLDGAANGACKVVATVDNTTIAQTVSSASGPRIGHLWARADEANAGVCYVRQSADADEIIIPKSATPVRIELPLETAENPEFRLRVATTADILYHYSGASQPAKISPRPATGPTAGITFSTDQRSLYRSVPALDAIDVEILAATPFVDSPPPHQLLLVQAGAYTAFTAIFYAAGYMLIYGDAAGGVSFNFNSASFAVGSIIKCRFILNAGAVSVIINDGTPTSAVPAQPMPSAAATVYLGCNTIAGQQYASPIWAVRDNLFNLGLPSNGFNKSAIDNFDVENTYFNRLLVDDSSSWITDDSGRVITMGEDAGFI